MPSGVARCLLAALFGFAAIPALAAQFAPYPAQVLALSPMAYWRLNETAGTTAYDFVGANNGVYTNVVLGQPGYGSTAPVQSEPTELAAQFGAAGAPSYVGIPTIDLAVPSGGNGRFTIAAWVKASSAITNDAGMVVKGYGAGDEEFCLDCGALNHAFRFFVRDAQGGSAHVAGSSVTPDNRWHWLVGVCDEANGSVMLYVDGTNAAQSAIFANSGVHASTVPASIGARQAGAGQPYNLQFLGAMDDVAIFTNALSAAQIAALYQAAESIGIQAEPAAAWTAVVGKSATNHVLAAGVGLGYQWYGPGGAIPGATNATLTLTNVQLAQAGTYFVIVSNSFGSVPSTPSQLQVLPAAMYGQSFATIADGTTNLNDGSQLFSTALGSVAAVHATVTYQTFVQYAKLTELVLTETNAVNVSSAFMLPDLSAGAPTYAFSVKWNAEVCGNFPNAGAGFSLDFGQLAGLDLLNGAIESGYRTGLCFSVQTSGNNPGFYLLVNGNVVAALTNDPAAQWGILNDTRHYWEVNWNNRDGFTARLDGSAIFYNVPTPGFVPLAGDRLAWAARTGSNGEAVHLGNIIAVMGGNLVPVATLSPYYQGPFTINGFGAAYAFDNDNWNSFWYYDSGSNDGFLGATVAPAAQVLAYSITAPPQAYVPYRLPNAWNLVGSTNGGASWSNLGGGAGTFAYGGETRAWLATNANSFTAYGLTNVILAPLGDSFVAIEELRFYKLMPFPNSVAPTGFEIVSPPDEVVASSPNSPFGQDATMAVDGMAGSKYLNSDLTNAGFTVFPSVTNVPVQAISLTSAGDAPERDPASYAFYGSHDSVNFTLIASNAVPPFAGRYAIQSFSFANTNSYAAYKIIFPTVQNPAAANAMQIAEVEFLPYGDITSPQDGLALQLPSAATLNGIGPAGALLDRQLGGDTNKTVVVNDAGNVMALITPAAGPTGVKGVELISGDDDAAHPGRGPSSLLLEGSNDGTNYVSLLSATPQPPTASMQSQGFSCLGNAGIYTTYRLTFGPPQSGNILQLGEIRLLGALPLPQLNAAVASASLALSWTASGYVVQQATNLASPNWITLTNAVAVTNGQNRVVIPVSTGNRFFRLKPQ